MVTHSLSGLPVKELLVKNLPTNAGDIREVGFIPGSGKSPGEHGNPLQYSCLENPMDKGAWWAIVHGIMTEQLSTQIFTIKLIKQFKDLGFIFENFT